MRKHVYLIISLICAACFSQFPEFRTQYLQRMGGALDEITREVDALDQRASSEGMMRYDYIRRFLKSDDSAIHREGQHMSDLLARQIDLENSISAVNDAPLTQQALMTLLYLDGDAAHATLKQFEPAIPITKSGIFHAFVGFIIGFLLTSLFFALFTRKVIA